MKESTDKPMAVPETKAAISEVIFLFIGMLGMPIIAVVLYFKKGDTSMLYLAAAIAAMAIWIGWRHSGFRRIRLGMELDRSGITTHGTVLEKLQARGEKHELHFDILYEYGDGITVWQEVNEKEFDSVSEGDTVAVRHLLRDPKYSRLELKRRDGFEA